MAHGLDVTILRKLLRPRTTIALTEVPAVPLYSGTIYIICLSVCPARVCTLRYPNDAM